ncbi:hypothetical protein RMCBS344292_01809 [Rhizopus microsporus]|nr:hypothetical protein RMCBS344292_01809 [Rhizopus microsporus]
MIPMKKWSIYEQELMDRSSADSKVTGLSGGTYRANVLASPYPDPYLRHSTSMNGGLDYGYCPDASQNMNVRQSFMYNNLEGSNSFVAGSEYGAGKTPIADDATYLNNDSFWPCRTTFLSFYDRASYKL